MELQELYDDQVLDGFIGIAVDEDKMDSKSFRGLLREYNNGIRTLAPEPPGHDAGECSGGGDVSLTRDCSYYEIMVKGDPYATVAK